MEMLRKLLSNEIRTRLKRNVIQSRRFSEMLEASIRKYQNRAIDTAKMVEKLTTVAKQMREDAARGVQLGLTDDEVAFYDALEVNDNGVKVLGDETLRTIAREWVKTVRQNTTTAWNVRENVRAHIKVPVRRILPKCG
jgi:type I restriction enzyme R subunit